MIPLKLLEEEVRECKELFKRAGLQQLLPRLNKVKTSTKIVESLEEVVTEADIASSEFLLNHLKVRYPGSFSEEHLNDDRWSHDLVWEIDPLDGTSEYIAGLRELFAVQGALLEKRGDAFVPVAGIIHLPGREQTFFSIGDRVFAEYGDSEVILSLPVDEPELKCFARRVDGMPWELGETYYRQVAAELGKTVEMRETGGAGAAFAELIQGKIDLILFNIDYSKEWDTSMAQPMLAALGGWICDLDGNSLVYNNRSTVHHGRGVLASISVPKETAIRHVFDGLLRVRQTISE